MEQAQEGESAELEGSEQPVLKIKIIQNFDIFVQVLGTGGRTGSSEWVTIGKIEKPQSYDLLYLRGIALDIIKKQEYRPYANIARLEFVSGGKKTMKVMLPNLW